MKVKADTTATQAVKTRLLNMAMRTVGIVQVSFLVKVELILTHNLAHLPGIGPARLRIAYELPRGAYLVAITPDQR
ncbi:hypothetical protein DDJ91_12450 [Mycobacteroides abscessus]|nr:hypothetical protein M879_22780 [Mycobacteroides abscessus V06705]PVB39057.1 hypothetical protein DDJ91_12450 [Mycobacteroides abscessus]